MNPYSVYDVVVIVDIEDDGTRWRWLRITRCPNREIQYRRDKVEFQGV